MKKLSNLVATNERERKNKENIFKIKINKEDIKKISKQVNITQP